MGIGPSTKETTLHHFRDPLLEVVSEDTDLDLLGILLVGTPDGNEEKMFVGTRAAVMAECMRADGVIISCDGWGNSHVDYTNTVEQIGEDLIKITFDEPQRAVTPGQAAVLYDDDMVLGGGTILPEGLASTMTTSQGTNN